MSPNWFPDTLNGRFHLYNCSAQMSWRVCCLGFMICFEGLNQESMFSRSSICNKFELWLPVTSPPPPLEGPAGPQTRFSNYLQNQKCKICSCFDWRNTSHTLRLYNKFLVKSLVDTVFAEHDVRRDCVHFLIRSKAGCSTDYANGSHISARQLWPLEVLRGISA